MATKKKKPFNFVHAGLVVAVIGIVGLFAYFVYYAYRTGIESRQYAQAEKTTQEYLNAISTKYPGKVTADNGCSRTNAKYSEGSLGCHVRLELSIELKDGVSLEEILSYADAQQETLPWVNGRSSTDNSYISPNNIKITVYNSKPLTCSVNYKYKDTYLGALKYQPVLINGNKVLSIEAGCSGPAYAEYY